MNAQFISPVVRQLVPYVPGEQPKMANLVKLNTNENPYPPSPRVVAAIQQAAQHGLQLYPDPDGSTLRQAIARHLDLTPQQVFLGNGSDEVLGHAFFTFFQQGCPLLMPDISYSFYKVYCGLYSIAARTVPLREDLQLNVADYAAPDQAVAGVVIANPNAPTGVGLPLADIETLLQMHPNRVVLIDEAYVDFGGHSAITLIDRYPNLLVVHTLSKSRSLAGLRIGYACGQAHLIEALNRVKNSFNSYPLDRLALAGGVAAFEDQAYFEQTCQAVMSSREGLALALEDLGFVVLPSQTNFVFARHPGHEGADLAAGLRAQGVLVRHFKLARIDAFLRISVGTPEQCDQLVAALANLVTIKA
ncbi:histidinol-phosphate transaminase [Rhodoferax sp.]|uniref:histidinol-phosphate transaminase n=1 Tax=Rhodoferax sp. TaxID=50421 RepID=UPI0025CFA8C9|nr:histidinol-phosphate transaminase [Rhodoferax sp.]